MSLCEGPFWDWNLTWLDTETPDFTQCFQDTVLVWAPCAILFVLAVGELSLKRGKGVSLPWTVMLMAKLGICIALTATHVCGLFEITRRAQGYHAAELWSSVIQLCTTVVLIALIAHYQRRRITSALSLWLFWLLYALSAGIRYRSLLLGLYSDIGAGSSFVAPSRLRFVLTTCTFSLSAAQFILHCFADKRIPGDEKFARKSPENDASVLSLSWFWWINSLIALGHKRVRQGSGLRLEDLWELDEENGTGGVLRTFLPFYATELEKDKPNCSDSWNTLKKSRTNVLYPLLRTFKWVLLAATLMKLGACLLVFLQPIMLDLLISFVKSDEPLWKGIFFAFLLLIFSMTESLMNNHAEYRLQLIGTRVRSALTHAIYCKALKLSSHARGRFTTGEIVTLMSVDSQKIVTQIPFMMQVFTVPVQISVTLYLLWQRLGIASLGGLLLTIVLLPVNAFAASRLRGIQMSLMTVKEKRTKLLSEILNGIRVLKLYAWEMSFLDRVAKFRDEELKALRAEILVNSPIVFVYRCAPFLVALTSFGTYVLIDSNNVLDANTAFVSLSLFNILNLPMASIPFLITFTTMALVSLRRINKYLQSDELDENAVNRIPGSSTAVSIKGGTFQYEPNDSKPILKNINLEVERGQLVAVVGAVGSGKSTLLNALLGDIIKKSGSVTVSGSVAYVPQQAWIQGTTIKNNILFGSKYNRARYEGIVDQCALRADLSILPGGDETEVGEKGINLSGGQKQRLALARAVYADADIYYFDDPLSAVDSHVSKHIFNEVISNRGALASKTRILTTHRLSVLDQCDLIYVLKEGRISEEGTYEELAAGDGAFANFLAQHLQERTLDADVLNEGLNVIDEMIGEGTTPPQLMRQISMTSAAGTQASSEAKRVRGRDLKSRSGSLTSINRGETPKRPRQASNENEAEARSGAVLVKEEEAAVGSVGWQVYRDYMLIMGALGFASSILAFATECGFYIATRLWLTAWSEDSYNPVLRNNTAQRDYRLGVYAAWGLGEILAVGVSFISLDFLVIRGSRVIHEKMLHRILRAPLSFFDTTPMGRILNRFSKDVDTTDSSLRFLLRDAILRVFRTFASLLLIGMQTPIFLAFVVPLGIAYSIFQKFYVATSRHLKRLESASRSPVYVHFSETLTGCSTIRAYGVVQRFIDDSNFKTDINHSAYYPSLAATRWLSVHLESLGYMIVFLAALLAVLARDTLTPGYAGLSITASLTLTQTLNQLVRSTSDLETNLVSVERCLEYARIGIEADWIIENNRPERGWPSHGTIDFRNYSTRYRDGLPLVVKNITVRILPGEKVGVVGRTGAGKSSLTLALFRLIEAAEGNISIDSLDTSRIGLHDLRSKLTIIPQEPILFSGTLRENLDPLGEKEDGALWTALEQAHLKNFVAGLELGLSHEVTDGGENMSVGQRQLVCLARALLRKTKILILDEATAAVDMKTDELIQETLRKEFKDSTTLTIAHRLNTILDYDRILVLSDGLVVEYDTPHALLSDPNSAFHGMAKDAGLV